MALQHPVFPAEMSLAEPAIPDDALRSVLARGGVAALFLRGRAAEEGEGDVQGAFAGDVVGGQGAGGGEVLAGVDDAEGELREVGAEGEEFAEGGDCG